MTATTRDTIMYAISSQPELPLFLDLKEIWATGGLMFHRLSLIQEQAVHNVT